MGFQHVPKKSMAFLKLKRLLQSDTCAEFTVTDWPSWRFIYTTPLSIRTMACSVHM
jgi:hypothetical protein